MQARVNENRPTLAVVTPSTIVLVRTGVLSGSPYVDLVARVHGVP